MVLPREGEPGLFVSASAPTLGHQDGPGGGGPVSLRMQPIAQPTSGADTYYSLPPIDNTRCRLERSYSFGPAVREAESFAPRLDTRIDSLTEKTFAKYSVEAGEQQERLKYQTPVVPTAVFTSTIAQRPNGVTQQLTSKAFASHRVPTPSAYKESRSPNRRFGPGPGLPINPRFGHRRKTVTENAYLNQELPDQRVYKTRRASAVFASPGSLPSLGFGSSSSTLRSAIVDTRLELRINDEIRRPPNIPMTNFSLG